MIDYLLDTHFGDYGQPVPTPEAAKSRLAVLRAEAALADEVGFDGVLVPDRHARTETAAPAALQLLAVVASETEHCRIGTFSLVLTLYSPVQIAEEAAQLDLLSNGRLLLSVSMGYHPDYFRQFGVNPRHRVSRFEEGVDVLRRAWKAEPFSFSGKRFEYDDVLCTPPPAQPGGPPLWFGGESPEMIARTARLADAWATGQSPLDRDTWLRRVESYRTQAEQAGRPSHVVMMRDGFVAPTYDEAVTRAGDALIGEQLFCFGKNEFRNKSFPAEFRGDSDFTIDNLRKHLVLGSPTDCIEQIEMYFSDYDIDELVLRFRCPLGPEPAAVADAIALFGSEVLPHVSTRRTAVS